MKRAAAEFRYEKLTWPEINDAVSLRKICIIPCGAIDQHGPHLPLDANIVSTTAIANGAGSLIANQVLVLPTITYGVTGQSMDFPGPISIQYQHFIEQLVDLVKSLAHHGFKKILLLNGHPANMSSLDLAARRANLETDAECILAAWWSFLTVDKTFLTRWRESKFPGGCGHACELETSLYLYLDKAAVRASQIKSEESKLQIENNGFDWIDLFASGPATLQSWTSSQTETGVLGSPHTASADKGRQAYEEAVKQLARFIKWFHERPAAVRHDHHRKPSGLPAV